ncbi:MAG: AAA family ATPase, partial [Coriobacteriales bacterium]|nr:AAA family ATPase [Coriobacteriales bacterium]
MILKRKIYDRLLEWKQKDNGASAIFIDGARRVGKSYVSKAFAKNEYRSYILIDFAQVPKQVLAIFEEDSADLDTFFLKLSAYYRTPLHERGSVIVFDEVQQYPLARQLIKHLVADHRYDYIETGSLITLRQNNESVVIPSEEEHVEMFPLDFEEFLWALDDDATVPALRMFFEKRAPLGQALHRRVMNDFRKYMLIGGMPQAVLEFLGTGNLEQVDRIKRRILTL